MGFLQDPMTKAGRTVPSYTGDGQYYALAVGGLLAVMFVGLALRQPAEV